jgi:hypothetical protein
VDLGKVILLNNVLNGILLSGRDSQKKYNLKTEIEIERRAGYAWYDVWPAKILSKQYPRPGAKN